MRAPHLVGPQRPPPLCERRRQRGHRDAAGSVDIEGPEEILHLRLERVRHETTTRSLDVRVSGVGRCDRRRRPARERPEELRSQRFAWIEPRRSTERSCRSARVSRTRLEDPHVEQKPHRLDRVAHPGDRQRLQDLGRGRRFAEPFEPSRELMPQRFIFTQLERDTCVVHGLVPAAPLRREPAREPPGRGMLAHRIVRRVRREHLRAKGALRRDLRSDTSIERRRSLHEQPVVGRARAGPLGRRQRDPPPALAVLGDRQLGLVGSAHGLTGRRTRTGRRSAPAPPRQTE